MPRVFIHFGPPKTGTSAVQNWLLNNRNLLLQHKIFYPEHPLDNNGISSGNGASLVKRSKNRGVEIIRQNKRILFEQCKEFGCNKLLLSSEIFFHKLPDIAKFFPNAVLIGYVRSPIELVESSYNQLVKRHQQTAAITDLEIKSMSQLPDFSNIIRAVGKQRFVLKPYHTETFHKGDIICDLLSTIDTKLANSIKTSESTQINLSYSLGALEFRRWLNQFDVSRQLHVCFDRFLQVNHYGPNRYSIIPPNLYSELKTSFIEDIKTFCEHFDVLDREEFVAHLTNSQQTPHHPQLLSEKVVEQISKDFFRVHSEYALECIQLMNSKLVSYKPEYQAIVTTEAQNSLKNS